ncbi:glycoside hydrolase family 95 protein [Algibacter mikhailovii]|uniref:glycoside hydrolase family 95 protein n=1 Tax=Algibacter mikhailovii TaxID=425498 RepID=UPI002494E667|nr:glycoside hydrolase family 95 protein [Algibacter mikhailovii]
MNTTKITSKFSILTFIGLLLILSSCEKKTDTKEQSLKLWYKQPAKAFLIDDLHRWKDNPEWLKALPLGNGSLGAMVFGDVNKERIQLNEESMWSGSPNDDDNPNAYPAQNTIRQLLFEGKYKEATELTQQTQVCKGEGTGHGKGASVPFGCFQTLGDLWLDFEKESSYENYHRELDLEDAVVRVSYTQEGVQYKREIFVSEPNQIMVVKLTADQPGKISFKSTLTRPEKFTTTSDDNQLIMQGALSDGKGGDGLHYMARLTALNKNGSVTYSNANIIVKNADEVTLLLTASTDYVLEYPNYKGRDYKTITDTNLKKGKQQTYKTLIKAHREDYQSYYKKVSLKLTSKPDTIATDIRLQNFDKSNSDLYLIEKLFQYGRYLLISSSRPGTLPANLQGIWANQIQTPWNGDFHTDINVQMNYWLAETTNLGDMHLPLFDLMESIQQPGAKTAKIHYNADGWVVHPVTNVWGFTSPGEKSDWGMHVGGGAWLTTHIMEHYYFTLDKEFLKETYPLLKGSTQFYLDWLIPDPKTGELISGPSVSPENTFLAPDDSKSRICMAPSHDQQVIWQLFKNFMDASEALEIKDDFLATVFQAQQLLAKPKIGSDGRLMEWNEEFEEIEPGHRHISHLFALHPGYQIDLKKTPELAKAAKKSLDFRIQNGGGYTGWSSAWLINQYARLSDAKNAEKSLNKLISKSVSPNLFGLHPPFQIDANFGATAGITEMLLQSQSGKILILPALPKNWADGEVNGLCTRGGFVIDLKWKNGELTTIRIFSKKGGICKLVYKGNEVSFQTEKEMEYFPVIEKENIM